MGWLKFINPTRPVIPAQAGIQEEIALNRHVIPAKAGIQEGSKRAGTFLDSRFRGNDEEETEI